MSIRHDQLDGLVIRYDKLEDKSFTKLSNTGTEQDQPKK